MSSSRLAILGDFNVHWDKPSDNHVKRFMELIDSVNIIQHVQEPTHIDGHIIDLIFTRADNHGIASTRTTKASTRQRFVMIIVKSELVIIPAIIAAATDATELFDKYKQSFQLLLTNMHHCSRVEYIPTSAMVQ